LDVFHALGYILLFLFGTWNIQNTNRCVDVISLVVFCRFTVLDDVHTILVVLKYWDIRCHTKYCSQVVSTLSIQVVSSSKSRPRRWSFHGFCQPLQANAGIVFEIGHNHLCILSTSPVPVFLQFNALQPM